MAKLSSTHSIAGNNTRNKNIVQTSTCNSPILVLENTKKLKMICLLELGRRENFFYVDFASFPHMNPLYGSVFIASFSVARFILTRQIKYLPMSMYISLISIFFSSCALYLVFKLQCKKYIERINV